MNIEYLPNVDHGGKVVIADLTPLPTQMNKIKPSFYYVLYRRKVFYAAVSIKWEWANAVIIFWLSLV